MLCVNHYPKQPLVMVAGHGPPLRLDFTSDSLQDGRKFRTLNVLDDYCREALGIEAVRRRG